MLNQCRLKILIQQCRDAAVKTLGCLIALKVLGGDQFRNRSDSEKPFFENTLFFRSILGASDRCRSRVWFCFVSFFFLTPLRSQSVSSPVAWMPTVLLWVVWLSPCFAHIVRLVMPYSKRLPLSRGYLIVCGRQCFQESVFFSFFFPSPAN